MILPLKKKDRKGNIMANNIIVSFSKFNLSKINKIV